MKATRSNLPYLIAAVGGALLFLFLFLDWLSGGQQSLSAWKIFSWADIALAILALATAAIAASRVFGFELPVAWLRPSLLKWLSAIALTITLTLLIELTSGRLGQADIEFGGWLSILACLAMLAGSILADRPDLAARVADRAGIEDDAGRPAAQPPGGLGSGSASTTTGAVGASSASGAGAPPPAAAESPTSMSPSAATGGATPAATPGAATTGAGEAGAGGGPPAGWYPDPQGQARLRYWDGASWTDQTSA